MKIGAIVQVRMGSQRFPGKALHKVVGKPMLQYLLERLDHCRYLDVIVVATSTDDSDTPIADFCAVHGKACYRGPLHDVAGRFKEVLDMYQFEGFVRVNGDSPFLDQRLIDKGVDIFCSGDFEVVTNVLPRTYPSGQSVEVVRTDTFKKAYELLHEEEDLEHVTRFFYKNSRNFAILNFTSNENRSEIHLGVDTTDDMDIFSRIVACMDKPHWQYGLEDILWMYGEVAGFRA